MQNNIKKEINKLMDIDGYPKICRFALSENEKRENSYALNFAESINTLKCLCDMMSGKSFSQEEGFVLFRIFLPQIHIVCEEIIDILKQGEMDWKEIKRKFPFIIRVKKLANFLKHPKLRSFFNEPEYVFLDDSDNVLSCYQMDDDKLYNFAINHNLDDSLFYENVCFYKKENEIFIFPKDEDVYWDDNPEDALNLTSIEVNGEKSKSFCHLGPKMTKVYLYFSEHEIEKFYSYEPNKEDEKEKLEVKLKLFCFTKKLYVFLPTISSLIKELGIAIDRMIEIIDNNNDVKDKIEENSIDIDVWNNSLEGE